MSRSESEEQPEVTFGNDVFYSENDAKVEKPVSTVAKAAEELEVTSRGTRFSTALLSPKTPAQRPSNAGPKVDALTPAAATQMSDSSSTMLKGALVGSSSTADQLIDPTLMPHNMLASFDTVTQTFWELKAKKSSLLAKKAEGIDCSAEEEEYRRALEELEGRMAHVKRMAASITQPLA